MPRLSTSLLAAAAASVSCADAFMQPPVLRGAPLAAPKASQARGGVVGLAANVKWQEKAEAFANPFTPPQDKPALLTELFDMREQIADSVTKVLRRETKPEEELLGPLGKRQLKAQETVRRQLVDDILPSARDQLQELRTRAQSQDSRPDPRKQLRRVQTLITDQLDDMSASGRLPPPPTSSPATSPPRPATSSSPPPRASRPPPTTSHRPTPTSRCASTASLRSPNAT